METIANLESVPSPALLFDVDSIRRNFDLMLRIANGQKAKAEYYNIQEFAIPNVSVVKREVLHAQLAAQNEALKRRTGSPPSSPY